MASGVNELIDQLYAKISDARGFPLGLDRCVLERESALSLLDEIRSQLPAEMAEAKRLLGAKQDLIRKAREEASQVLSSAQEEARLLVDKEKIVLAARKRAAELITEAEAQTQELRRASSSYADEILRRAEESLGQSLDSVRRSRSSFRNAAGLQGGKD